MPLTDTQWATAVADVIAGVAAGTMTEAEAAEALANATLDWPTRTLSNADLGARIVTFLASMEGVLITDGPPDVGLGENGTYAFDGTNADFYGPKTSEGWGEPLSLIGSPGSNGTDGVDGVDGEDGWTPVPAVVSDGARRVLQVADWTGGSGAEPASPRYVGAAGLTTVLANAVDIRGAAGSDGEDGSDGLDSWSPVLAIVNDGARRVFQVVDWVGGEGTKPTTGLYVGAAGLTATLGDGVNVRGPAGEDGVDGDGAGDMLAANNLSDLEDAGEARTNLSVMSGAEVATAISAAIDALVSGAPGALDTINELAAALGDDADFAATVTAALAGKLSKTVSATARVLGRISSGSGDVEELTAAQLKTLLALAVADISGAAPTRTVILSKTASYTVTDADCGATIEFDSAADVTLTVAAARGAGFNCAYRQLGTGKVIPTAGSGATIRNRLSLTQTAGVRALGILEIGANGTDVYIDGDLIA